MKPELPKRRWSDRRRINLMDPYERHYWSKFFGVDERQLLEAVDLAGTGAEDVRRFLAGHQLDWIVGGREDRRQVPGRPSAG